MGKMHSSSLVTDDRTIRAVLKRELLRRYAKDHDTLIVDEFGIMHGVARIDVAVINHRLHGYEIKSDLDDLKRLPDQIRAYSAVMDRVTLIVGYRHAYDALRMIPEWWGVKLASMSQRSGCALLSGARLCRDNPGVDLNALVSLLWREEALRILHEWGQDSGFRSKKLTEIYRRLVDLNVDDGLQCKVREQLRLREHRLAAARPRSCDD